MSSSLSSRRSTFGAAVRHAGGLRLGRLDSADRILDAGLGISGAALIVHISRQATTRRFIQRASSVLE